MNSSYFTFPTVSSFKMYIPIDVVVFFQNSVHSSFTWLFQCKNYSVPTLAVCLNVFMYMSFQKINHFPGTNEICFPKTTTSSPEHGAFLQSQSLIVILLF